MPAMFSANKGLRPEDQQPKKHCATAMDLGDGNLSSLGGDEDIAAAFKNNDKTSANDDNDLRVSSTTPKLPVVGPMRG